MQKNMRVEVKCVDERQDGEAAEAAGGSAGMLQEEFMRCL